MGEPGDDEALIRNTVIGLNFVDVYYRRGSLPVPAFPAIIGDEAAGVVEVVGKNVKNVSVGDRVVYGDIAFGAYLMLILLAGNAYYFFLPGAKHWSNCRWNCCISYGNLGYLEEIKQ